MPTSPGRSLTSFKVSSAPSRSQDLARHNLRSRSSRTPLKSSEAHACQHRYPLLLARKDWELATMADVAKGSDDILKKFPISQLVGFKRLDALSYSYSSIEVHPSELLSPRILPCSLPWHPSAPRTSCSSPCHSYQAPCISHDRPDVAS